MLAHNIPPWLEIKEGISVFHDLNCPVRRCRLTFDNAERTFADLVLFHDDYVHTYSTRSTAQIYALYFTESPPYTNVFPYPGIPSLFSSSSTQLGIHLIDIYFLFFNQTLLTGQYHTGTLKYRKYLTLIISMY